MPLNRIEIAEDNTGRNTFTFPLNPNEYYPIDQEEYSRLQTIDAQSIVQKPVFDSRPRRMVWYNLRVSTWKSTLITQLKSRLFTGSNYYYIRDRDLTYLSDWTRIKILDISTEMKSGAGPLTYSRIELIYEYATEETASNLEIGLNEEAAWHPTWGHQTMYYDHWRNACNLNHLQYTAMRNFTDAGGGIDLDDVAPVVNAAVKAGFQVSVRVGGWTHNGERAGANPWRDEWDYGWNVDAVQSTQDALEKMPDVRYWQIDNEPSGEFFAGWTASEDYNYQGWSRYHELLKRQAAVIRASNPANKVISPGIPDGCSSTSDEVQDSMWEWLESYFRYLTTYNEKCPFDILAFHLWSTGWHLQAHDRWRHPYRGIGHRIRILRSLIDEYGFNIPELWITEGSRAVVRSNGGYQQNRTEEDQRNFLIDVVSECLTSNEKMVYMWFAYVGDYATANYYLIFNDTGETLAYYKWKDYCNAYNTRM